MLHLLSTQTARSGVFVTNINDTLFICSNNVIYEYGFVYGEVGQAPGDNASASTSSAISDSSFYYEL